MPHLFFLHEKCGGYRRYGSGDIPEINDAGQSFIVVNVLGDIAAETFDISDEALEEMADAFDFSAIP